MCATTDPRLTLDALTLISGYEDLARARLRSTENASAATTMVAAMLSATQHAADTVGRLRGLRPAPRGTPWT